MQTKRYFILILLLISVYTQGQSFYVRAGLGAAICTTPHLAFQSTYTDNGLSGTTEVKKGGLGDGLPMVAAAGYYFTKNFGVELGVDYFYSFTYKLVSNYNGDNATRKTHGSMLAITPALVFKFDLDKFSPYARLGIMIGVLNSIITKINDIEVKDSANIQHNYDMASKLYGGIAVGVQAAVGAEYALGNRVSLFGEVNLDGISYAPKKGKYTTYTLDGADQLPTMTTYEKSWVYLKKVDGSLNNSSNEPMTFSLNNYSFANVGLIVGVKINLGK
jgi:hypothetical protein